MKKYILLIIILFNFINLPLFAYEDELFKISDKFWTVEKQEDKSYILNMKDFPETDELIVPRIEVGVLDGEKDVYTYLQKTDETLKNTKKFVEDEIFKDKVNAFREFLTEAVKGEKYKHLSNDEAKGLVENLCNMSKMGEAYYKDIGKNTAIFVDFTIGTVQKYKFIEIITLTKTYVLLLVYSEGTNIDDLDQYKDFLATFEPKDGQGSYANAFLHANWLFILVIAAVAIKKFYDYKNSVS